VQDIADVVGVVIAGDRDGTGVRAKTAGVGVGDNRVSNTAGEGAAAAGAGVVVQATPLFTSTHAWVGVLSTPTIPFTGVGAFFSCLGWLGGRACCWGRGSCCVIGYGCVVVVVIVGCFCVLLFVVILLLDC